MGAFHFELFHFFVAVIEIKVDAAFSGYSRGFR